MDVDFANACPLVRPALPHTRFLFVGSRLCSTLPSDGPSRFRPCASLARISHTILADWADLRGGLLVFCRRGPPWRRQTREVLEIWPRKSRRGSAGLGVMPRGLRVAAARCQAGEARALAAAARRVAAQPQAWAAGHADAIATLMRRTLTRTRAPILSSLRRMVPQVALANGV